MLKHISLCAVALVAVAGCSSVSTTSGGGGNGGGGAAPYEPFPNTCSELLATPVCDQEQALCGNGVRDTCEVCMSQNGGPVACNDVTEVCDGSAVQSCSELGYVGGAMACSDLCIHDERDCNSCLGPASQIACARPRIDAFEVADLELASDGTSIAAAWTSFDDKLYFARFSSELELLDAQPCTHLNAALIVSIVAHEGGWLRAVGQGGPDSTVILDRLDNAGNVIGTRTIANATAPILAARPGATPLLVYHDAQLIGGQQLVNAELLDENGDAQWHIDIANAFLETTDVGFADPGFVITYRNAENGSQLVPLSATGELGTPRDLGDIVEMELAGAGSDRVAAVWRDGTSFDFHWLDGQAQTVAEVEIAPKDTTKSTQEHQIAILADGGAVVGIVESSDNQLSAIHIGADGSITTPKYTLASEPLKLAWLAATGLPDSAALAWTTYHPFPSRSRFVLGRVGE